MISDNYEIKPIAYIRNAMKTKFGVPRQSGLVPEVVSEIEFVGEFACPDAFRGLEGFSHIWLIWSFSEARRDGFSPTVRPPRLGGNERVGVFATRSPFRPNSLALSCVKIVAIETRDGKTVLKVAGADLKDGTPIYDIKPYLPYADRIENAESGFAKDGGRTLEVIDEGNYSDFLAKEDKEALFGLLSHDPRPQYQSDEERIYGMEFGEFDVKFSVKDEKVLIKDIKNKKGAEK
ncbi:MAG: tRNA (N6-threonylcarbamoyladenosine(37)-N6)-methyltransferase TrmO [Clostridiales bacterium]|nr:tRNA (N6-threonylcarbamoyladenosine(37)-N6)-methyltransferase TrmO [Candidatus Coliplasma equi]